MPHMPAVWRSSHALTQFSPGHAVPGSLEKASRLRERPGDMAEWPPGLSLHLVLLQHVEARGYAVRLGICHMPDL